MGSRSDMKRCFKCHRELPLTEFYRHPQMGDGHLNKCKACAKADSRRHYHGSVGDPAWLEAQRKRGRDKYYRLYRGTPSEWVSPEAPDDVKAVARNAVGNAVRDGRLEKPDDCQECGTGGLIHGHHEDYYKPLEVVWLCTACHSKRHRKVAA
jgi:hypothetical protein